LKLPMPDSATKSGRLGRVAIAVAAGGGLALGVAGLAHADPTPGSSGSPSAGASAPAGAPGDPARRQHQPHLDGTVKSIGGGHIMIVDRDGFTRQINIATVPSTVKVGVRVVAVGAVNADGVSLDATSVTPAPDRPDGRPGPGGRGEGPGGPGHRGPSGSGAPPAPSGSGAPKPAPTTSS
jgi:hypothetical protein